MFKAFNENIVENIDKLFCYFPQKRIIFMIQKQHILTLLSLHVIFCLLYSFYRLLTYNTEKLSAEQKIRKQKLDDGIREMKALNVPDWVIASLFIFALYIKAFVVFSYVLPFINGVFSGLGISSNEEEQES